MLNQVNQIEYDFEHWNHKRSITNARKLMQSTLYNELPIKAKLTLYYYQINYQDFLWFFDVGPDLINLFSRFERELDFKQMEGPKLKLFYYTIKIQILYIKNEMELITSLEGPCITLTTELESKTNLEEETKKILALFYHQLSIFLFSENRYDEEFTYLLKTYELWDQLQNYYFRFYCILNIMVYYGHNGKEKEKLQFLEKNYNYFKTEQNANPVYASEMLSYMAECYWDSDSEKALEYSEKALENYNSYQSSEENESFLYSTVHGNFVKSLTLIRKGDIEGSIIACKLTVQGLEKLQQLNFNHIAGPYPQALRNLGMALAKSGDLNLALEYHLKSLNIFQKGYEDKLMHLHSMEYGLVENYLYIIQLKLQLENLTEARKYLVKMQEVIEKIPNKETPYYNAVLNYKKYAEGLLHKNEGTFEDMVQAKTLLKEIITKNIRFGLMTDTLVSLIEISIQEYKTFQNRRNYQEIVSLISRLEKIGEKYNSLALKSYSLLLGGKIELIEGNIRKAEEMFTKSLNLAKDFKLSDLIKKGTRELEKLQKEKDNWEKILLTTSVKERFELLHIEDYIKEGKQYVSFNNEKLS